MTPGREGETVLDLAALLCGFGAMICSGCAAVAMMSNNYVVLLHHGIRCRHRVGRVGVDAVV